MSELTYTPVVDMPADARIFDFSRGEIRERMSGGSVGIGRYNEDRRDAYRGFFHGNRTVHMGIDLFMPAGTPVKAFAPGVVFLAGHNPAPGDYGYTLVCQHELRDGRTIYALYGHLGATSIRDKQPQQTLAEGEVIGTIGNESENGGWPPHVHFQLAWEAPATCDMPGVVTPEEAAQARLLYPDPSLVLGHLALK